MLEWLLVLAALDIPHHPRRDADGLRIELSEADVERARREIDTYERENADWPPPPPQRPPVVQPSGWSAAWVALLLGGLYVVFGPYDPGHDVLPRAASMGERIAGGEWWRLLTSLGVHADFPHLGANLVSILVFGSAAATGFGGGLAWMGALLAAMLANVLSGVVFARPGLVSFGASTGVFALLGLLVGQRLALLPTRSRGAGGDPRPLGVARRRSRYRILGAGAAIFALLGTAPHTNVSAHFWGLACGTAMGLLLQALNPRRVPDIAQRMLELLAVVLFLFAWRLAITGA